MAKKKVTVEKISGDVLGLAIQSIIKAYGEGVITLLGEHEDNKVEVISTGCLSLDAALGVGGFEGTYI